MADNRDPQKAVPFPVRGTPGGYRDIWDDPDDAAETRERLENAARLNEERARAIGTQEPQQRTPDEGPNEDPGAGRS
jgi:hypothetical protein